MEYGKVEKMEILKTSPPRHKQKIAKAEKRTKRKKKSKQQNPTSEAILLKKKKSKT